MARSLASSVVQVATSTVTGRGFRVPDSVQAERIEVCKTCPSKMYRSGRCLACGCFLSGVLAKTAWSGLSCNKGHWGPYVKKEEENEI